MKIFILLLILYLVFCNNNANSKILSKLVEHEKGGVVTWTRTSTFTGIANAEEIGQTKSIVLVQSFNILQFVTFSYQVIYYFKIIVIINC